MTWKTSRLAVSLIAAAAMSCSSDEAETRTIDADRADVRLAVASNEQLSPKLIDAFHEREGNLFYSPLSIEAVAGMLYAGAKGETAEQLAALLDAPHDPAAFHTGLGDLMADLDGEHGYTLSIANSIFPQRGEKLLESFADTMNDAYRAPTQTLDYQNDAERAREQINRWVEMQTQGKIDELFESGDIHSRTVLALVNAMYFKADWAHAFDKKLTRDAPFTRADLTTVSARMMTLGKAKLRTASFSTATLLELPYRDGELSFLAMLPEKPDEVPELEQLLAGAAVSDVLANLQMDEVTVQLPRFTLRTRFELTPVFQALGATDMFDASRADLSGINGSRDLFVDAFVHEAWVSVDETGTEAAAATGAAVAQKSARQPLAFDHPFVFMIYDNRTGTVLFTGRVMDPTAK
jgi:serpin B